MPLPPRKRTAHYISRPGTFRIEARSGTLHIRVCRRVTVKEGPGITVSFRRLPYAFQEKLVLTSLPQGAFGRLRLRRPKHEYLLEPVS